jgi:hypothetical protein
MDDLLLRLQSSLPLERPMSVLVSLGKSIEEKVASFI